MSKDSYLTMAREAKGLSGAELARLSSLSPQQLHRLEKGQRKLTKQYADMLAPILDVSPEYLIFGANGVLLIGNVGAGNEAHYYANGDQTYEEVDRPPESTDHTVALQIRGDSMYPLANDGDLLYFDDVRTPPTEELVGKLCVVCLADDRILVKRLAYGRTPGLFDLISTNAAPIPNVVLVWAARVKWIKPA